MGKTLAGRLHLRAIKCPRCGAQMPDVGDAPTVTCEYCDLVSEVVRPVRRTPRRAPQKPVHPVRPRRADAPPQVTPQIRPLVKAVGFVLVLAVVIAGATVFLIVRTQPDEPTRTQTPSRPVLAKAHQAKLDAEAKKNAASRARAAKHASVEKATGKTTKKNSRKKKRRRKPDGYKIANIIEPALKGCAPRDIHSPRFPVRYTPTVTLTIKSGKFQKIRVTVKASKHDLAKLSYPGDRSRKVTQDDLDKRESQVARCIKKGIAKLKIPASSSQRRTTGKIRVTFSYDGVPYGVKNL